MTLFDSVFRLSPSLLLFGSLVQVCWDWLG